MKKDSALRAIAALFVPVLLSAGVMAFWYAGRFDVKTRLLSSYVEAADGDFDYEVENVTIDRKQNKVVIGWIVDKDEPYEIYDYPLDSYDWGVYNNVHVGVIRDGKVIEFPTKLREREDINSLYGGVRLERDAKYGFMSYVPEEYADDELVILAKKYGQDRYIIYLGYSYNGYEEIEK